MGCWRISVVVLNASDLFWFVVHHLLYTHLNVRVWVNTHTHTSSQTVVPARPCDVTRSPVSTATWSGSLHIGTLCQTRTLTLEAVQPGVESQICYWIFTSPGKFLPHLLNGKIKRFYVVILKAWVIILLHQVTVRIKYDHVLKWINRHTAITFFF